MPSVVSKLTAFFDRKKAQAKAGPKGTPSPTPETLPVPSKTITPQIRKAINTMLYHDRDQPIPPPGAGLPKDAVYHPSYDILGGPKKVNPDDIFDAKTGKLLERHSKWKNLQTSARGSLSFIRRRKIRNTFSYVADAEQGQKWAKKLMQCPVNECGFIFDTTEQYLICKHLDAVHPMEPCIVCGDRAYAFMTPVQRRAHMNTRHPAIRKATVKAAAAKGTTRFSRFTRPPGLPLKGGASVPETIRDVIPWNFCDRCGRDNGTYCTLEEQKHHLRTCNPVNEAGKSWCEYCALEKFDGHLCDNTQPKVACELCGYKNQDPESLKFHKSVCKGYTVDLCNFCSWCGLKFDKFWEASIRAGHISTCPNRALKSRISPTPYDIFPEKRPSNFKRALSFDDDNNVPAAKRARTEPLTPLTPSILFNPESEARLARLMELAQTDNAGVPANPVVEAPGVEAPVIEAPIVEAPVVAVPVEAEAVPTAPVAPVIDYQTGSRFNPINWWRRSTPATPAVPAVAARRSPSPRAVNVAAHREERAAKRVQVRRQNAASASEASSSSASTAELPPLAIPEEDSKENDAAAQTAHVRGIQVAATASADNASTPTGKAVPEFTGPGALKTGAKRTTGRVVIKTPQKLSIVSGRVQKRKRQTPITSSFTPIKHKASRKTLPTATPKSPAIAPIEANLTYDMTDSNWRAPSPKWPTSPQEFTPTPNMFCSRCFRRMPQAPSGKFKGSHKAGDPALAEQIAFHEDPTKGCGIPHRLGDPDVNGNGLPNRSGWIDWSAKYNGKKLAKSARQMQQAFVKDYPMYQHTVFPANGSNSTQALWANDPNHENWASNWTMPWPPYKGDGPLPKGIKAAPDNGRINADDIGTDDEDNNSASEDEADVSGEMDYNMINPLNDLIEEEKDTPAQQAEAALENMFVPPGSAFSMASASTGLTSIADEGSLNGAYIPGAEEEDETDHDLEAENDDDFEL